MRTRWLSGFLVALATSCLPAVASAQEASISIAPPSVSQGGSISVTGTCGSEADRTSVPIVLGGGIEGGQLARIPADPATGDFSAPIAIPERAPTGSGTVAAACGLGSDNDPRAPLTIVAGDRADGRNAAGAPPVGPGDRGRLVSYWQDRLNDWLALADTTFGPITVDGIFGPNTERATRIFQNSNPNVEPDGTAHPTDRVALREAIQQLEGDSTPDGTGSTQAVRSADYPASGPPALLERVELGAQMGTQLVFEFVSHTGELSASKLSYEVEYVETSSGASGEPVAIDGDELLQISMSPASRVDLSGDTPRVVYEGPESLRAGDGTAVRELVLVEDFESLMTWTAGLDARLPFAVDVLENPLRLVVHLKP